MDKAKVLLVIGWVFLLVTSQTVLSAAEAPPKRKLVAVRTKAAPTIDGRLDDPCWKGAPQAKGFSVYKDPNQLHPEQTIGRVCYDDDNLYLAIECQVKDMEKLKSHLAVAGGVFGYKSAGVVEVFLDTDHDRTNFRQVLIHANGSFMTLVSKGVGKLLNEDYLRCKARVTDNGFTIEAVVPFAMLYLSPKTAKVWGFNLNRGHHYGETYSSWNSVLGKGFQSPGLFGELTMNVDLSRFCWKVDMVSHPQVGDKEVKLRIKNETRHDFSGKLALVISSNSDKAPKYERAVSFKAGAEQVVSFKHSVIAAEKYAKYKISLTDETGKLSYLGNMKKAAVGGGGSLKAPPGLFKDLNDQIVGDAVIINGKQLFIDDYIIEELKGAEKILNQPKKHPKNPLMVPDQPWEKGGTSANGTAMYDRQEKIFKIWYTFWLPDPKKKGSHIGGYGYATSKDGITWKKPPINDEDGTSAVKRLNVKGFIPLCVFKDPVETDPQRRYKLFYNAKPDGTAKTWTTTVAFSPDGFNWTPASESPLIAFSDTQANAYWDSLTRRYVAYLRYGPPNTRLISRIESEDFINWSPKVTVLRRTKMDDPFGTKHYGMRVMPYEGICLGLITAYHGETIQPIPKEKEAWMDKSNVQLSFSRNGLTWHRVGRHGVIDLSKEHDWQKLANQATFIPGGRHGEDWDWGQIYTYQKPIVVGDEIWIYYTGLSNRHWASYHGDTPRSGIGLATLRLDGFVSIDAASSGTMTTKKFVFIGDTLEVNANAKGGSIVVEALDSKGKVIEGFSKKDSMPITTDGIRHVLKWKGKTDCHLIQARPIRLRFHMKKAKLYSFTPRIRNKHYIQSYD